MYLLLYVYFYNIYTSFCIHFTQGTLHHIYILPYIDFYCIYILFYIYFIVYKILYLIYLTFCKITLDIHYFIIYTLYLRFILKLDLV